MLYGPEIIIGAEPSTNADSGAPAPVLGAGLAMPSVKKLW